MGIMRKLFTTRSEVAGLPVGRRRTDWSRIAKVGAAAAAGVGAGLVAGRAARTTRAAASKGKEALDTAADIRDKATSAATAAGGARTTMGKVGAAIRDLGSADGDSSGDSQLFKQRLIIREQIEVGVPKRAAYNQWTQFEDFPNIFKGVTSAEQQDDETVQWTGKIGPSQRSWRAKIVEQTPDERIKWITKGGVNHRGVVTFHEVDDNLTRVQLEMEYFPQGFVEKFANLFLTARHRTRKDLRLFKHFIELQGEETGAWRGEIDEDEGSDAGEDAAASESADDTDKSSEEAKSA